MEIVTPHWQRTMAMDAWSIGMDKTFIRIKSPAKDKGIATLRIENEMWNYLPKTNKVIKVPPSMMMSSWMGSDFTNDDLVREFSLFEDYSYEMIRPENAVDSLLYVNCIPREDLPVVWGNVVIAAPVERMTAGIDLTGRQCGASAGERYLEIGEVPRVQVSAVVEVEAIAPHSKPSAGAGQARFEIDKVI